jgi:hypothetical protein
MSAVDLENATQYVKNRINDILPLELKDSFKLTIAYNGNISVWGRYVVGFDIQFSTGVVLKERIHTSRRENDEGYDHIVVGDTKFSPWDSGDDWIPMIQFLAGCDRLEYIKEIAKLKAENAELRLLPGAPDYFAAKEHYESLEKKE